MLGTKQPLQHHHRHHHPHLLAQIHQHQRYRRYRKLPRQRLIQRRAPRRRQRTVEERIQLLQR